MKTLRVLLVQNDPDIAESIIGHLRRHDLRVEHTCVRSIREFGSALSRGRWNAVLSDFTTGGGTVFDVLESLREIDRTMPLIVVADDIGEETAASLIRRGISDHLELRELDRLSRVVAREIRGSITNRDKFDAESALEESETRLQLALSSAGMGVWELDLATDEVFWSPECSSILGLTVAGTKLATVSRMLLEEDLPAVTEAAMRAQEKNSSFNVRVRVKRYDSEIVWVNLNGRVYSDREGRPLKAIGTLRDITKEKKAEEALIEAEQRYRIVAETASDAIVSIDGNGNIIFANRAIETIFGFSPHELLGRPITLLMTDEYKARHDNAFANYLKTGVKTLDWQNLEGTGQRKDGSEINIQISFGEFRQGEKVTFTGILRDVTARKRSSDALRRSERNFRALVEATTQYVWTLDNTGLLIGLPDWWTELTGQSFEEALNFGWVNTLHPEDRPRVMQEYIATVKKPKPVELDVRVRDANGDYRSYRARVIPVFDDEGNASSWVCALTEQTAQRLAEDKLRKSEERYRMISSVSTDYMYATGVDETGEVGLDWVTGAFEKITGYTQDDFIDLGGWRSIVHPDDKERDKADYRRLFANEPVVSDIRIIRKNGETAWIRSYARPIWDETANKVTGVCGAVQDITQQKLAEFAVRESEDRLRTIVNAEPECVKLLDRTGVLLDINPAGLKMIEADSLEQVVGHNVSDIVVPEYREAFLEFGERIFSGENGTIGFEIIGMKGTRRFLESHAVPMRGSNGDINALLAVTRDITERKKAEQYLIESQKQYAGLINSIEGIVWEADIESFQFTFVSEQAEAILGYPRSAWYEQDFWPDHIHPDDKDWVVDYCLRSSQEISGHTFEYRMIAADGRVVWFRDIVSVVPQDKNSPVLRGIMVDITDRKKGELEIIQRSMLIDQAFEAIFTWDFEKGITDWNKGCERLYGYTKEEAMGKFGFEILKSEFPMPAETFLKELKKNRYWSGEVRQVTRDGRVVYADSRYQMIEHDGRWIVLQTNRDVTDRHLAEMRIRESEARYRYMFDHNPYPMFVWDTETMKFLAVNDAALMKYGYSREEFSQMSLMDIRPAPDIPAVMDQLSSDTRTVNYAGVWRHKKKDGTVFSVEVTSHALEFLGKPARLVLAHDISDRLKAEEELKKQREQLDKTAECGILPERDLFL